MAADSSKELFIAPDRLRSLVADIFERCNMSVSDARLLADTLVYADMSGINSHGVLRVPEYVRKLTEDGVDANGRPAVVRTMGGCMVVDGGNSMGQIGMHFAMQRAIERAEDTGIAAAAIRGSNHSGAMAYFAAMALAHNMIGFATTNALPTMAPWGGADKILGINPLGVAIPAATETPLVYDAAFSGSSHGKIRIYQQKGLPLPEGWALDAQGRPTTDPSVAIDGLLAPIGGFKGTGLALIMGIMSSMLSGAAYGTELGNMIDGPRAGQDGHFVMAISIAAFEDVELFKRRVDEAIKEIHNSRLAAGVERIYVPGELEHIRRQKATIDGVPLNPVTVSDLLTAAADMGITNAALT